MAHESQIIELLGDQGNPVRYNVADGNDIPRMTLLKIGSGNRVAEATGASNEPFAGFAASEKVANDGVTTIDVFTCGLFYVNDYGDGGIPKGSRLRVKGANTVTTVSIEATLQSANCGICITTMNPNFKLRPGEQECWNVTFLGGGL